MREQHDIFGSLHTLFIPSRHLLEGLSALNPLAVKDFSG